MSNKTKVILDCNMFDFFMKNKIDPISEANQRSLPIEFGITLLIKQEVERAYPTKTELRNFCEALLPRLTIFSPKPVFGFGSNNSNFDNAGFSDGRLEQITGLAAAHPTHGADLLHMGISADVNGYLATQEKAMAVEPARQSPNLKLISFWKSGGEPIGAHDWLEYLMSKIKELETKTGDRQ
ncbi:MAG: hypothetical protein AB7E49_04205 [Campylobacterales bacterium]